MELESLEGRLLLSAALPIAKAISETVPSAIIYGPLDVIPKASNISRNLEDSRSYATYGLKFQGQAPQEDLLLISLEAREGNIYAIGGLKNNISAWWQSPSIAVGHINADCDIAYGLFPGEVPDGFFAIRDANKNRTFGEIINGTIWLESGDEFYSVNQIVFKGFDPFGSKGLDMHYIEEINVNPIPGDANSDGVVDLSDLAILATSWNGQGTWYEGDFDRDGEVGLADLAILASNWHGGADLGVALESVGLPSPGAQVPEPASIVILATGAAALFGVRGRRRAAPIDA